MDGGTAIAKALKQKGISHVFALCGGHISPILVGARQSGIRVVDVRGNRIVAARCTLPLSQNPYFVHTLGTRHRAAVGLTEETDSVVVVVSEETGEISLAISGQISRGLSLSALRDKLTQILSPPAPEAAGS